MADELNENAEFGRKHKNEEEPILVAQRFLNIFRQMHIFNKQRRQQFDAMLLDMPSDIRILLSTLPGGSVLIEHIEELEKKNGLISMPVKSGRASAASPKQEKDENGKNNKQVVGGTVVIDASFANELSSSLTMALQQTERRYKEDIRTLTETLTSSIMESQTAIGNMIKDVLLTAQKNLKTENDKPQVIVLPPQYAPAPAATPAQTLLPENTEPIITKDLMINKTKQEPEPEKMPEVNSKPEPQQTPKPEPKPEKSAEKNKPVQPKPEPETKPKKQTEAEKPQAPKPQAEIKTEVKTEQPEPLPEPVKKKKKKNKKNKNKAENAEPATINPPAETAAVTAAFPLDNLLADTTEEQVPVPEPESADEQNLDNFLTSEEPDFSLDDLTIDEPETVETTPEITFSDEQESPTPAPDESETPSPFENELDRIRLALQEDTDDEEEIEETPSPIIVPDLTTADTAPTTKTEPTTQPIPEPKPEPAPKTAPMPEPVPEPLEAISLDSLDDTPVSLDDISFDTDYSKEDSAGFEDLTPPDYSPVKPEQPQAEDVTPAPATPENDDNSEWVYVEEDGSGTDQDWEWEYVDDNTASASENGDDEWEWEYVEDDGSDEGDWEWEYVEEGDNDTQNPPK